MGYTLRKFGVWSTCVSLVVVGMAAISVASAEDECMHMGNSMWEGVLTVNQTELPLRFQLATDERCSIEATLISVAQGGAEMSGVGLWSAGEVDLKFPTIDGRFVGNISDSGSVLTGIWSQGGGEFPLVLMAAEDSPNPDGTP